MGIYADTMGFTGIWWLVDGMTYLQDDHEMNHIDILTNPVKYGWLVEPPHSKTMPLNLDHDPKYGGK